jgi:hypothetical protein
MRTLKTKNIFIRLLITLTIFKDINYILTQPSSSLSQRPVLPTASTPVNTDAYTYDLGTPPILTTSPTQTEAVQTCRRKMPRNPSDCFSLSASPEMCCYFFPSSGGTPFCYNVPSKEYDPYMDKYEINGITYSLDCGQSFSLPTPRCGMAEPKTVNDCNKFDRIDNSCCLYNQGNVSYCFWLGHIGRRNITQNVNCDSHMISFNLWNKIFVILNLILLLY